MPGLLTLNINCDTPINAVQVSGATETQKNGTYVPGATVNGRTSYELAPNHVIEWNGTQYINRDIFVGTDWITTDAPTAPWLGTWVEFVGSAPISGNVDQTTLGTYCYVPAGNGTVYASDGVTEVLTVAPDGSESLGDSVIKYRDAANDPQVTDPSDTEYDTGSSTLRPATEIPRRELVDEDGVGTGEYVTLADLINNTLPVVTPASDFSGAYPALTENTPTYNDEGTGTTGWTITGTGTTTNPSASVCRFTQTATGVGYVALRTVTMPVTNKDYALYFKVRARQSASDAQNVQIRGAGTQRVVVFLNFNTVTSAAVAGTISIRYTNAAATNFNAVVATGVNTASDWTELCLYYDSKYNSFSVAIRQTDGSWYVGGKCDGEFFTGELGLVTNNLAATTGAWIEFDYLTLVSPNIISIGDSLTQGANLFSPVVASGLIDGDSTWQRWAPLYPALRNNFIANKGVGGNTTAMVAARIQADVLDNLPKLVMLSACNNDFSGPVSFATRTTNTQSSIDLCLTAGSAVVLFNATYVTIFKSPQPDRRDYFEEWWTTYRLTLTGLSGSINIMGGLKDPAGYADVMLTDTDNVHPTPTGYRRMGEWIAALPYA